MKNFYLIISCVAHNNICSNIFVSISRIQCCVKFIESHYSLKTTITKHRVRRDCLRSFLQVKITHLIVVLHNQYSATLMLFKCCIDLSTHTKNCIFYIIYILTNKIKIFTLIYTSGKDVSVVYPH